MGPGTEPEPALTRHSQKCLRPPRSRRKSPGSETLGQIRATDNKTGRSAIRQLERFRPIVICNVCRDLKLESCKRIHLTAISRNLFYCLFHFWCMNIFCKKIIFAKKNALWKNNALWFDITAWTFPDTTDSDCSINETSTFSRLPVTVTVCVSVNMYCCKPYISLCYSFIAFQDHNTLLEYLTTFLNKSQHQVLYEEKALYIRKHCGQQLYSCHTNYEITCVHETGWL